MDAATPGSGAIHMVPVPEPASSSAADHADSSDVVVLHVRPGSEFKALIYLLRQINRRFRMDDALPELPEGIADFEYRIITWPTGGFSGVWSQPCMA